MAQYNFSTLAAGYDALWANMRVTKVNEANAQARKVIQNKSRYQEIEQASGVPWAVIGCLHMRESNGNFATYLGNGQPLNRRTTIKPTGRGPFPDFKTGALDALAIDELDKVKVWTAARVAYSMERFNGFGYRNPSKNIPSPYLWGGTSVQKRGKYVRDGVYDKSVMDPQLGGMAVLKQIMELDKSAQFSVVVKTTTPPPAPKPAPDPAPEPAPPSPKAEDTESQVKPVAKSKTMWGNAWQTLIGYGSAVAGWVQGMPTWLVVLIIVAITVGTFLIAKGYLDIRKIVKHLSEDDTPEAG